MDLSQARILVSNDDGINAPGIKVLEKIAKTLSDDVWVVAPESEQSASGHSLTLTLPLRVRRISRRKFAVNGTPTDSVLLAVQNIIKGKRPDLVLSGVNAGGNLGEDVTYSGTVAAAMEGALLGIPSIALSQARVYGESVRWGAGWPRTRSLQFEFVHRFPDRTMRCRGRVLRELLLLERQPQKQKTGWVRLSQRPDWQLAD